MTGHAVPGLVLCLAVLTVIGAADLPTCPERLSVFNLQNAEQCKQVGAAFPLLPALSARECIEQLIMHNLRQEYGYLSSSADCLERLSQRCCARVRAAIADHCHCWNGLQAQEADVVRRLYEKCTDANTGGQADVEDIRLFVGVLTSGHKAGAREAIRGTWGADKRLYRSYLGSYLEAWDMRSNGGTFIFTKLHVCHILLVSGDCDYSTKFASEHCMSHRLSP